MDIRYTELAVTVLESRAPDEPEGALAEPPRDADCGPCTDCTGCSNCTGCSACTGCSGCTDCSNCTGCSQCSACSDCTNCTVPSITPGCPQCGTNCTVCTGTNTCNDSLDLVTDDDLEVLRAALLSVPA